MRYRYRNDEELKDSGVERIGKIPKDWSLIKLKYISHLKSGEYISKDEYDDNGKYNIYGSNGVIGKSNKINNVKKNIIIGRVGACGEVNIATEGWISDNALILDVVSKNYNFNYVVYSLNSMNLKELASGTAQPLITGTQVKNLSLVNLDKNVQIKIANFLDEKTSQFNLIISKKEKLIERLEEAKKSLISEVVTGKLKVVKTDDGYELIKRSSEEMKDSGVEWLGDIPKDWEVKRIKQISRVISKGTTPSTVGKEIIDKGEIRFLKAENIYEGKISLTPEFFIDEETNKILKRSELKENDILFVIAGATIGKVAIVQKEHCPANTNQAISFIRLYDDINYKFVYYWLNSPKLQENMWLYAVQSAQPNLSMENLGNFYILYPNKEEIEILTDYIEQKSIEIINIMNDIKYQIEKLKEAKQSLISEAVTGKIEILD